MGGLPVAGAGRRNVSGRRGARGRASASGTRRCIISGASRGCALCVAETGRSSDTAYVSVVGTGNRCCGAALDTD